MKDELLQVEEFISQLLKEKKYAVLKQTLSDLHPADASAIFEDLIEEMTDEKDLLILFRLLPKDLAAETFSFMNSDMQEQLMNLFSDKEMKEVLEQSFIDDTVDLIEEMPANVVKRILQNSNPQTRQEINQILNYPADSAGSIMTTEYISLRPSMTVDDAFTRIRRVGSNKETIYTCYVTLENRKLIGMVSVKDLLSSEYEDKIRDIMETNLVYVETDTDKEEVAATASKYDFLAVPVVDKERRLVGIVTIDDVIDVIQEENTEDIEKMAAMLPSEKPYLRTSVFTTWKQRIPWLLLLMISATFTGKIINSFQDALAANAALTAFIPMLMDTGGNSGSQASVTIIRGMSLDEIEFSDIFKIIWKELRVAILCGATLAVCNFVKLLIVDRVTMPVAMIVCLTLVITVIMAKFIGCTLPMLAKKAGFDPAVMASPFITTIVDALSLIVYFTIATRLFGV